jgi:hypothetical protein
VRCSGEVWQCVLEGARFLCLEEHKGHAGAEQNDVRGPVFNQNLAL